MLEKKGIVLPFQVEILLIETSIDGWIALWTVV